MTNSNIEVRDVLSAADILDDFDLEVAMENIADAEIDFCIGDYRFIRTEELANVLAEDLKNNEELGYFNPEFLSDNVPNLEYEVVTALQEALGDPSILHNLALSLLGEDGLAKFAKTYLEQDGAGAIFGRYDGQQEEVEEYSYFRMD